MITYGKQTIDKEDIKAVVKSLKEPLITQGKYVEKFEKNLCSYFGSKYASVFSSGTAALHTIGNILNWKKNDIIITTPITFVATANSAIYSGSNISIVDINLNNYSINIDSLYKKIKFLLNKNKKISAIIVVDYAGHPSDWKILKKIASKFKITLINDNCHALGAKYFKRKDYAIQYADFVIHSYHPVKNITTGEGGAILSNSKKYDKKAKIFRNHGIIRGNLNSNNLWEYEIKNIGYNYRITDFQCALGISQLKKLSKFVLKKQRIAKIYNESFNKFNFIKIPSISNDIEHSYHLYVILIDFKKLRISKGLFFKKMLKKGIKLQVHYIPLYRLDFFKKKFNYSDFKNSEYFYKNAVSLPIYPSLSKVDQKYVIDNLLNELK
tara:strand:- start:726 stop:1871 length:1146 start_codon:yes stop_codon:yes gene_type:complete